MANRDPYLVLGVAPTAPPEDIRTAYRKLSKEFHPDVNQDISAAAQDKMKEITAAYQVVSNKQKREDYDKMPLFKVRVPRGFTGKVNAGMMMKKKEAEKQPGIFEKLLSLFVKVEQKPKKDPARAMTHFTMGMTMTEKVAFYGDAKAEFAAAMKADPDLLEAAFNYGLMAYKLGDFNEARIGFQKATRVKPDDSLSRQMLDLLRMEDNY